MTACSCVLCLLLTLDIFVCSNGLIHSKKKLCNSSPNSQTVRRVRSSVSRVLHLKRSINTSSSCVELKHAFKIVGFFFRLFVLCFFWGGKSVGRFFPFPILWDTLPCSFDARHHACQHLCNFLWTYPAYPLTISNTFTRIQLTIIQTELSVLSIVQMRLVIFLVFLTTKTLSSCAQVDFLMPI